MPTAGPRPDDALPGDEIVIRRVPTLHPRPDGKREVSKGSFAASSKSRDPEEGMSVDLLSALRASGIDPADPAQFAPEVEVLMTLRVGDLHANGMWVVPRPQPHPAHCNVLGVTGSKRKIVFGLAQFLRRPADVVKAGET
jgi:hypothetical protein